MEAIPQSFTSPEITNGCDLLIISTPSLQPAADTLAAWKNRMGLMTMTTTTQEVGNTPTQIKNYMQNAYDNWNPAPSYLLFIGDHPNLPGHPSSVGFYSHITDLRYACLDGPDYFPDIGHGRISVVNLNQALKAVRDIINYEKNPLTDPAFYTNTSQAAYFQHAGGGYAERRFAQTSEEIHQHLTNLGYNAERIYYTEPTVNPTNWNNTYYSNGEPIPPALLRSNGFQWSGNSTDISNAVNSGIFLLTHRDHGSPTGWSDPYFTSTHVNNLTNGDKLPVVFSLNCSTGDFEYGECFAEAWLRNPNGGAIGVIAASATSYSGNNDGLAGGLTDAIWPGYVALFPHNMTPNVTPHPPIYRMGDVLNQGKFRMSETWGSGSPPFNYEEYTFELFHWFGDPSMEIRTAPPQNLSVNHPPNIFLGNPQFTVNVAEDSALVALSRDGDILARAYSDGGVAQLTLASPITIPGKVDLVVSKHDYVPYIAELQAIPASGPYLYCIGHRVIDSTGNDNAIPEAGESLELQLELTNFGIQDAQNVSGTLSSQDSLVQVTINHSALGFIAVSDTVLRGTFAVELDQQIPHLHQCLFDLHLEADGGYNWDQQISMTIRKGAKIVLPDTLIQFPNTFLNFTSSESFTIENGGPDTLHITDVISDIPQFYAETTSLSVAPGAHQSIQVNFLPTDTLQYSGTLTILNTDPINFETTFNTFGIGINAPDIAVSPDSISETLNVTDSITVPIQLNNVGLGELNFTVQIAGNLHPGTGIEGAGGSDNFGHIWIDSDEADGPEFQWIDISQTGTLITLTGNDAHSDAINLSFDFPFYGEVNDHFWVCTNGWLSFAFASTAFHNRQLPSISAPREMIALLWDNLNFQAESKLYFQDEGNKAIILFKNVYRVTGEGPYTFEVILYESGNILLQYLQLENAQHDYTVGIQNLSGDDGLTIAHNEPYLHDSLAVLIRQHNWTAITPTSGTISAQSSTTLLLTLRTIDFPLGIFQANVQIESNDPDESIVYIPITMTVDSVSVGIEHTASTLPQKFVLQQNWPNPFNPTTTIAYALPEPAHVELIVYNLLGQRINTLVDETRRADFHQAKWDGTNDNGQTVGSGVYIYQLRVTAPSGKTSEHVFTRKMLLIR